MGRIRFILLGAVIGLTWAASLRAFMQQLAGPDSTFTFSGTFGIIIPTGIIVNLAGIAVTFLAPKPYPDLSYTAPHGAWFGTLAASLGVTLALACSIPMRRPDTSHSPAGQTSTADMPDHRPPSTSIVGEPAVDDPSTVKDMPSPHTRRSPAPRLSSAPSPRSSSYSR